MIRGISLLRLSVVSLAGSVIAGCTASTLTAQSAAGGIPLAALLVGAAALALVAALLVWRRRRTSVLHAGSQVGWSVIADGPAARDGEFALAPSVARADDEDAAVADAAEEPHPSGVEPAEDAAVADEADEPPPPGIEPVEDAPDASENTAPDASENTARDELAASVEPAAPPFAVEPAAPPFAVDETSPPDTEPAGPTAPDDIQLPVADAPPADAPDEPEVDAPSGDVLTIDAPPRMPPTAELSTDAEDLSSADTSTADAEWWLEDEPPAPTVAARERPWGHEPEPIWDLGEDTWLDEPEPARDLVEAAWFDEPDPDEEDDRFGPPPAWRR